MRINFRTIFMACIVGCTSVAHAQYQSIGNSVQIGPITAFCKDPFGNQVKNYAGSIGQAAMASIVGSGPAIVIDPSAMGIYPPAFRVFTYVHECGHHVIGHVIGVNPTPSRELQADCYAAKKTRDLGWLSSADFNVAMQVLSTFVADAGHPSGQVRVANARNCYRTP